MIISFQTSFLHDDTLDKIVNISSDGPSISQVVMIMDLSPLKLLKYYLLESSGFFLRSENPSSSFFAKTLIVSIGLDMPLNQSEI